MGIVRIAGPVVVGDVEGASLGDMVRVGEAQIIGEIIGLKGDKATIQTYEETNGLGIGEQIESTHYPMSVELGPGLIGSIYDGIQRPLDLIEAISGSFIPRGISVPSLDRDKRWHFVPKTKKGEKIQRGQVVGTVKETELVEHKVMAPLDGTVEDVKEGDFTVEEVVATISGKDMNMIQRWPVRLGRPYIEKVPPSQPLITGQRVLDTFFPIIRGGAACVSGPFGSGKCVSGRTPLLLGNGEIITMEELFKECLKREKIFRNGSETVISLNPPLPLFSLGEEKIEESKASIFYKGMSDSLLKVKTKSGRLIEVTPAHKLFRVAENGEIVGTAAGELKVGDFITAARRINLQSPDANIDPYSLEDVRVIDLEIREEVAKILRELRAKKELHLVGLTPDAAQAFIRRRSNAPTLGLVKKLYSIIKKPLPVPKLLRGARRGNEVSIPIKVTPELAELLGLFIAEGNIRDEGTIVFTNSETELLERFSELCELIFGIRGKIIKQETRTPYVLINSRVLVKFLRSINASGPAAEKQIPGVILRSSDKVLASFLRGYYLGDGSFYKGELELSTSSDHLHIGLSYLLTRLGILHILARKEDRRYRIFIRGLKNLEIFYRRVGNDDDLGKIKSISQYINSKATTYTSHDVVPLSREVIEELYRSSGISYTELKKEGIEISNYITNGEHMSATTFQKFASLISSNGRDRVQRLASLLDHIYCDKIVSIEEIEGPMDVFDVSVPGLENFVGGFGGTILHNTVVQHQLARWSDADVIIFVGCGERGNEMSQVLLEFPELTDPKTGRPLMERTILVANTSNMPFAAREASIYTGITMAEYYRDMGYDVAIQADSTSRWAEALREISGRLEEMPGEEGYPAYLASRIAAFYERSGVVKTLGGYEGSITVIGSVSPPGGDFSEPVTQSTLRFTKVFWALDAQLAYMRHFPAVSWLNSYSLYVDDVKGWWEENVSDEWRDLRERAMALLQRESELQEIVSLIGTESLSDDEKLILEVSKHIREDFLYQSAFHEIDTFTDTMKQYRLLRTIMLFYDLAQKRIGDMGLEAILELPFRLKIARAKYVTDMGELDRIDEEIKSSMGGEDG